MGINLQHPRTKPVMCWKEFASSMFYQVIRFLIGLLSRGKHKPADDGRDLA